MLHTFDPEGVSLCHIDYVTIQVTVFTYDTDG